MPGPVGRDLEWTRSQLQEWLPGRLGGDPALEGASDFVVGEMVGPEATGFSSDTLIFDLHWKNADGSAGQRGLVARIDPDGELLFPEYDLALQFQILTALAPTGVPVPGALLEETSGEVIGASFYLMEKVEGRIPPDNPPYNAAGWVTELAPADRGAMWRSYIETLVAIHALDPKALGLSNLAKPELGATPIEQELAYYERYFDWAFGGREHPTISPSLEWLRKNRPDDPGTARLVWGDARVGNVIFRQNRCVAVLDWEMARLASPMMDLAWGTFTQRYHSEGCGVPILPGFPGRAETIALYEELGGVPVRDLAYYEVLAGMRFSVILIRLAAQLKAQAFLPEDSDFEIDNPVSNLHGLQLREMGIV